MIELGCGGWMADFGEYLPTDTYLHNGVSAEIMHNAWPALWAKCNYEALEERASSARSSSLCAPVLPVARNTPP
ncbi:putative glycosyl hydrolase [Escherichia coli]|uniref:Putative glycosyl hydrolase n=1 Tax=Escherichia coli TaxID=562 RepID=A0A485JM89_ECOLX|nr:putative glycosyl hydrolase [Escherichia coli]